MHLKFTNHRNKIKNKLHENFIFKIRNDIFNSDKFPKLRTYKKFKTDFRFENHLVALENRGHQIALSKFRISSHNIRIETGRYDNPKSEPNERLCIFCDMQVDEDGKHFLLECPLYTDHRTHLLHVCYTINQNEKFIEIMKNKDHKIIAALGKYLHNSMTKCYGSNPNAPPNCKRRKR